MNKFIDLEKLNEAMQDLNSYFKSKGYHRSERIALCSETILIETTVFSVDSIKKLLLKGKK